MTTRNDVTGDKIQTKVKEESYYDSPFWDFVEKNRKRLAGGSEEEGPGVGGEAGASPPEVDESDLPPKEIKLFTHGLRNSFKLSNK
jgi:hypothetical protein